MAIKLLRMKKTRSFFGVARYWNKLVRKFYNLNEKITKLIFNKNASAQEVNILLDRLQKLFRKLKRMQVKAGVKIAGSALALMLATTSLNAQNFVQTGVVYNRIQVAYGSAPTFADFDNDGNIDLFVGDGRGYILKYKQITNGDFVFADTVQSTSGKIDVGWYAAPTLADIDGDGDLDLYVGTDNGVILYFANTNGNFSDADTLKDNTGTAIDLGYYTVLDFEDVDNDGDLDLYAGSGYGYITKFENISGVFQSGVHVQAGGADIHLVYTAPTFTDIDGDGDQDLVVGVSGGNLKLYRNNGDGTFAAGEDLTADGSQITAGSYAFPSFADIDGDGDDDLYLGFDDGYIMVFENDGSGNLSRKGNMQEIMRIHNSYFDGLAIGDVDSDGDMDIVLGAYDNIIKTYQQVNGEFVPIFTINSPGLAHRPTLADLDNNGTNELYVGIETGFIQVYNNTGSGFFILADSLQADGSDIDVGWYANPTFADFDGDGDLDLFVGDVMGNVYYFENNAGTFNAQGKVQADGSDIAVSYFAAPALADIDFDGDLDLVVSDYYGVVHLYKNDGNGNLSDDGQIQDGNNENINAGYYSDVAIAVVDGWRNLYSGSNGIIKIFHQLPLPVIDPLPDTTAECSIDTLFPPLAYTADFDTVTGVSDASFPITSNTTVTWTYTDSLGFQTTQTQNVVINDNEAPTLAVQDFTAYLNDTGSVNITAADLVTSASDNCSIADTALSQNVFTCSDLGIDTVIVTLTDGFGNQTVDTSLVTVVDNLSPAISCIENQTVDADSSHSYTVSGTEFDPTATDDNCGVDSVYNSFNSTSTLAGASLPEGTTTITWYAYDASGNVDSCSFDVTVNAYTGISATDFDVAIYPNPSNGVFTIENTLGLNVEITDVNGRIIEKHLNVDRDKLAIDFSSKAKGIYWIKLYNDKVVKTRKLIIK